MVANAMLAAMAKHASKPGLEIYQVASSNSNPLPLSSFVRFIEEYFQVEPFLDSIGKPIRDLKFQPYQDVESYVAALLTQVDFKSRVYILQFYSMQYFYTLECKLYYWRAYSHCIP